MSVELLTPAFKDQLTKGSTRLVLFALANISDNSGRSFPSIKYLARSARVSRRTAQTAIRNLEEVGWLTITHRVRENGSSTSHEFWLHPPEQNEPNDSDDADCAGEGAETARGGRSDCAGGALRFRPHTRQITQKSTLPTDMSVRQGRTDNTPSESNSKTNRQEEISWRIEETWKCHLGQREMFYLEKNGKKPPPSKLTDRRRRLIRDAIKRWDDDLLAREDRERWEKMSYVRAAGMGIFLDPWMTARDQENDTMYLEPERCWKIHNGVDQVERWALPYFEAKGD